MKILGNTAKGFLVDIAKDDLSLLLGSFYKENVPIWRGEFIDRPVSDLRFGDEIQVKHIHDLTYKLTEAAKKFIDAHSAFKDSNSTMLEFSKLIVEKYNKEGVK